jgi:hypothetical protein
VPNGYMLDMFVFLADFGDRVFETTWESIPVGFKLYPSVLKLTVSSIINRLPIVINDEIRNIDIIGRKGVYCSKDLFICELLTETIPRT